MTKDYSVIKHAQSCVTELRILLNQLSEADTKDKIVQHKQSIKDIMKVIEFDVKDLIEDKVSEIC